MNRAIHMPANDSMIELAVWILILVIFCLLLVLTNLHERMPHATHLAELEDLRREKEASTKQAEATATNNVHAKIEGIFEALDKELETLPAGQPSNISKRNDAYGRAIRSADLAITNSKKSDDILVASIEASSSLTNAGFQALLLINGGAIIAILTLIGSMYEKDANLAQAYMSNATLGIFCFAAGLVAAVVGIGFAFHAQVAISRGQVGGYGPSVWRRRSFKLGVVGLLLFLAGTFCAAQAVKKDFSQTPGIVCWACGLNDATPPKTQ